MATYTDNYQLAKPVGSDVARISTINGNMDKIDTIMHASQVSIADAYDQTKTYDVGDVVMYEFFLYKCITAVTSAETFDPTKWERTTAATSGSSGTVGELGDLEDVELTSPTSGESLKYDGSKWVNGNVTAELPDFIEETSGNIVTVNAAERPAKSLKVAITPVQSGSGDPSPDNIRPISGWTECNVVVSSTTDAEDGQTYPITFSSEAGTVYGGTLDVVNGVLTVTNASVDLGTLTWQTASNNKYFYSNGIVATAKKAASSDTPANMICEQYKSVSRNTLVNGSGDCEVAINTSSLLQLKDARFAEYTPSDVQTAVTGIKLVYELATPQTYQLTPTEVQMLLGTNNIWADTGEITEFKYIPQTYDDLLKEVSGGGDASYAELTQAEYDALTPAEKENGTIYFITDGQGGGGGGGSSEISYSTEERKIGTWIDGSDLYEKTLVLSSLPSTSGYNTINHGIADVDFIFLENATLVESTGQTHIAPYGQGGSGNIEVTEFGKTSFLVWVGLDRSSWSAYITVRYTKEAS